MLRRGGCEGSIPTKLIGEAIQVSVEVTFPEATMPVFMSLTGVPSNKQEETKKKVGKIPIKDICYIPLKGQIAVLNPVIDKISITYKIDDLDLKAALIESLLQEIEEETNTWKSSAFKKGSIQYKASAQLAIPSNSHSALVQIGPTKKNTSHSLRLEFNPAALGASGIAFLKDQLESLVPEGLSYLDIITNGLVTRVDIAVDVVGVNLADLVVSAKDGGKHHWYHSAEGKPETGYLGLKKSDKNAKWTAYNKRQQIKDSSGWPTVQAHGGLSHTRIEYRATPNKTFLDLNSLKNPFFGISLAYPTAPKEIKPYIWSFFIDSCTRRGEVAALAMVPEGKLRTRYQKSLEAAHASFWRPSVIWTGWENALVSSGLLLE